MKYANAEDTSSKTSTEKKEMPKKSLYAKAKDWITSTQGMIVIGLIVAAVAAGYLSTTTKDIYGSIFFK